MEKEYLWGFYYNPMVEESCYGLVSLHRTKKGAEIAMEFHKNEQKKEFEELYKGHRKPFKFGYFERWIVDKIKIQD